jgi:heptosyltransferase-1
VRILLVRTSALGDVVHALPVLTALARAHPAARFAWAVDEVFAPLLAGHADLERVVALPLRRARRAGSRGAGALATWRALAALRAFGAEVAVDLMGNHKGALLARLSGARRRLGWPAGERREGSSAIWINEPVASAAHHAVDRGLALARALGAGQEPADFAPERLALARDVSAAGYAYIHPGAAWGNKRYPPALWGRVARLLAGRAGLEVRVGAAPGEEPLADAVAAASQGAARRHDAPSLGALAAALAGAALVLAGDTGALHLARAFGRPLVGLYGPTDPERHGPYGAPEAALRVRLPCSFCHRVMDEAKPCLETIPPERVVERALAALAAARAGSPS